METGRQGEGETSLRQPLKPVRDSIAYSDGIPKIAVLRSGARGKPRQLRGRRLQWVQSPEKPPLPYAKGPLQVSGVAAGSPRLPLSRPPSLHWVFQVAGCRLQVSGFRLQVAGCRFQVAGCRGCRRLTSSPPLPVSQSPYISMHGAGNGGAPFCVVLPSGYSCREISVTLRLACL